MLGRCKCHGRRACIFCFVQTITFPLEHVVWEKLPGFATITHALGL